MPIISIIAALDQNKAIGKNGNLLCYLPNDLKRFKKITSGHSIVMGRKTFESLPNGALPNRRNIVLSHNKEIAYKNCEVVRSLNEAFELCKDESEVFVIGGAQIYEQAIEQADRLYLTIIHQDFEDADAFFPKLDLSKWVKIQLEKHQADEDNKYGYRFENYIRKS